MRLSLRTLLTDLEIRADVALAALDDAPPLDGRTDAARDNIEHTRNEARRLLKRDLDTSSYPAYRELTQNLFEIETFELPFLLHHGKAATRATKLCSVLLEGIRWPYEPMLVSTFSTRYYSTYADRKVIALPAGEERRLLGVPDLCHELGHTVYSNASTVLVGDFLQDLRAHLRASRYAMPELTSDFTNVYFSWLESWLQEFVCDLVATYLVGPAFPRQHARLRAMRQPPSPVYEAELDASHPADHARMQACLHLIDASGFDSQAAEVRDVWNEILDASGQEKPDEYELFYPPSLLWRLVDTVTAGCKELELRPYDVEADAQTDIPRLANEAWERLEREPEEYASWEQETLSGLWENWGLA